MENGRFRPRVREARRAERKVMYSREGGRAKKRAWRWNGRRLAVDMVSCRCGVEW